MSEEMFVACCSPTLANIKACSLFCCCYESRKSLYAQIAQLNRRLSGKGVIIYPLSCGSSSEKNHGTDRALLCCVRISKLQRLLLNQETREFLSSFGYDAASLRGWETALRQLSRRMASAAGKEEFPHEIGVFLDYPLDDVKGFILNRGRNYKSAGLWKVYGDKERAEKIFERYRRCTDIYCRLLREGRSIEKLTVRS